MERLGPMSVGGTIGILGGGQLGRMMALAGRAMGLKTVVWDPSPECPAAEASDSAITAPYDDSRSREYFANLVDRVTYEFENVDYGLVRALNDRVGVYPSPEILHVSQHRLREKERARQVGLRTCEFMALDSRRDVGTALDRIGLPAIMKTVHGGYDGKGQRRAESREDAYEAYDHLKESEEPLIYEQAVPFVKEVSVMVARDLNGMALTYPTTENHHQHGILDYSLVPARIAPLVAREAEANAKTLAEALDLVGVMAIEFFVTKEGAVLVNEMAPRPHNSGHWTLEGAWPSQFTQHMRAVAGWPIAKPVMLSAAAMANLLGDLFLQGVQRVPQALLEPGVQLHWYGKSAMRPGRKVGHLTAVAPTPEEALNRVMSARQRLREDVP